MPRYEVGFFDARSGVKLTIELDAVDGAAAEWAARLYLRSDLPEQLAAFRLVVGTVRGLR